MKHERDFVTDEIIDLEVEGYDKGDFKYKPTTAGEENLWLSDYMKIGKDGKVYQDFSMLNKLKLNNLQSVPYNQVLIKKKINVDKEWKDLNIEERWSLLGKLSGAVFDKILVAVTSFDRGDSSVKKA